MTQYWLMKSEPDAYSIHDLENDRKTDWDGVRNYQARNFMRDDMRAGDQVLFYHSNAKPPGIAGLARVSREAFPDYTAWDVNSKYFDPKASSDNPTWQMVEIEFVCVFSHFISLQELKEHPDLGSMIVTQKGSRLSIQPVEKQHFNIIKKLGLQK